MRTQHRRTFETLALFAGLVALSFAFRIPALVNAGTVDSDAAIVGLQARHILHGEWSWFLYGSGYQTSVDSFVAAAFFAVLGATPFALVLSTLCGHIAATCLAFATLARHLSPRAAFVAVLPLVFTSSPLHTYILNPPRQASLTLVFVAVFVIDGASRRISPRSRLVQHAVGAAVASLACFADPYALLFLPALVLLGVLASFDGTDAGSGCRPALRPSLATLFGTLFGLVPFALLLRSPHSAHGETTLTLGVVSHNAKLLLDPCLPWLLGTTAYAPHALLGYSPWEPSAAFHTLQRLGGVVFLLAVATGGVALVRSPLPWPVRRLGGFGFVVGVLTLASFLVSTMVMDLFSSRYLAALVLMSPFAITPLAARLGERRLVLLLAPYLVAAGVAGWVGYGDQVRGAVPAFLPGRGAGDEMRLEELLEARGVRAAIADYWVSYRLTFLYEERVVVVPVHEKEDRYRKFRDEYGEVTKSAYIFDPKRSREDLLAMQREAFGGDVPWGVPVETLRVGDLTAIVFEKTAIGGH